MIAAPIALIVFSLSHGSANWSHTQHLRGASLDEWVQHLTTIRDRWLAAHTAGLALFPLLGLTIWWMLPARGILPLASRSALIFYMPFYVALDAVYGIGSSILVDYRERLPVAERAGADGALSALFYEPSAIDWLDRAASMTWEIGAIAAALALWRTHGWRVSIPLAASGWALGHGHYPPEGVVAGITLGVAVSQYLIIERRVGAPIDLPSIHASPS